MDGIINIFNDLVGQVSKSYEANGPKYSNNKWKYCVALAERGWKPIEYEYVPTGTDDDVIVTWRKKEKQDIKIRLSFTEQCLWLRYLEQKEQDNEQK